MDCLFCKIVAGDIPNYTVYEDDNVLAFLDIHPCTKGHTVVVLKQHFSTVSAMGATDWGTLMAGVKASAERVRAVLNPDAVNITINDGEAAGQSVPHTHWHILPRWQGDGGGSAHSIVKSKEPVDVGAVASLFK